LEQRRLHIFVFREEVLRYSSNAIYVLARKRYATALTPSRKTSRAGDPGLLRKEGFSYHLFTALKGRSSTDALRAGLR